MSAAAALGNLSKADPVKLAIAAAIVIGVVYLLARKTVSDVADGVGGVMSGRNAATEGTDYYGTGLIGTVGSVTNTVTGGWMDDLGSWIGGKVADWTQDKAALPALSRKQAVGDNFYNDTGVFQP